MPKYGMPGVAVDERVSRRAGFAALVVAAVVTAAGLGIQSLRAEAGIEVVLRTPLVGDGVVTGADVRLDGVTVGRIADIAVDERGSPRLTLRLDDTQLAGLTDSLLVDYAPSNMFGISEVELRRGPGGAPLRDGAVVDLAGAEAHRVSDATMGALMRSLAATTDQVLTPRLTDLLTRLAGDLKAFTPILEAVVMLGRSVADTQRLDPSYLIGRYADTLAGAARFSAGTIELLDRINNIEALRGDRRAFDGGIQMIVEQLFVPGVSELALSLRQHLGGYAEILTPLLTAAAATVADPRRSSAEVRALLAGVDRSFVDTPEGPVLRLEVVVSTIPVLAPVLGGGQR
ncbi:MlaD family protein [Nocardia canadensis]|uniref:MlaD family protein n=1 Tax=Nocardia canadensis TaxID=3065238 RepID=UPI00292EE8A7|nr:MlaD family protein [Nocardia canadensis]